MDTANVVVEDESLSKFLWWNIMYMLGHTFCPNIQKSNITPCSYVCLFTRYSLNFQRKKNERKERDGKKGKTFKPHTYSNIYISIHRLFKQILIPLDLRLPAFFSLCKKNFFWLCCCWWHKRFLFLACVLLFWCYLYTSTHRF